MQSSNSAFPAPTPEVTVQMCSTCQTSVLSTSVVGYVPGTACLSCQPSAAAGADGDAATTPNLIGRRAVSATPLTGRGPAEETQVPGGDGSALWSSSPTAPAPTATFVTAGAGRSVVRAGGGLAVLIFGLFMAVW